jgi:hypothetical protein
MTFRQLGWRQLAEAEEARSATALRSMRSMGGELMRELQNINRDQVAEQAATETAADPMAKYDQATILYAGIAAWSYPSKPTPQEIDSLDAATARWAALEIVNLGAPPVDKEIEASFFGSPDSSMATPATQTVAVRAAVTSTQNGSSA